MDTRLKEVRQTDLTEGRINQEFVDWMQTKGTTYLLMALVALCVYLGIVRWKSHQVNYRAEAWKELTEARIPADLDTVASKYAGVDAVSDLAHIRAATEFLSAVQNGQPIGAAEVPATQPMTDTDRESYLDRADNQYKKVIEGDDHSMAKTLIMVQALNGRAAVAESRGKLDEAKSWYEQAAKRAEQWYPTLAEEAHQRAATAAQQTRTPTFPAQTDLAKLASTPETRDPVSMDDWARELLLPKPSGD